MVIPRRLVALGLAALLLAGMGIAVAATRDDSDETAAPVATTTVQPVDTTSSTVPDTSTTTVPVIVTSTPPSSRVTSTPTTVRRGNTTVPRVTTTRPPASPTTTTGAVPNCKPAQIDVTITTNRPSYTAGQEVRATSTLRNKSSETCFYNGYGFTSAFKDTAGKMIIGQSVIADSFADVPLRPGQTITHSGTWDQRLCGEPACGRAPTGPYIAAATWNFAGFTYEFTVSFIVA